MTSRPRAIANGNFTANRRIAGIACAISLIAAACTPAGQTGANPAGERDLGSKQQIASIAARIGDPKTVSVCGALVGGDETPASTTDIANSPVVDGVPAICTQLDDLGFVATKKDDGDFDQPEICDENMGKIDIGCFRSCLELSNEFALDDQSIEDWRSDADFCAASCEIGCDGTVGF